MRKRCLCFVIAVFIISTFLQGCAPISNLKQYLTADDSNFTVEQVESYTESRVENELISSIRVDYELDTPGVVSIDADNVSQMSSIPGIIGTPFSIRKYGANVLSAKMTIHLNADNKTKLNDCSLMRFDTENQMVVPVKNVSVDHAANAITAQLTAFGTYAVVNTPDWVDSMSRNLPTVRTTEQPYYNVVLVLDKSGSMDGEKITNSIASAQNFVDVLADDDILTVISFSDYASVMLKNKECGKNRQDIKNVIASLSAGGWTDIDDALRKASDCCYSDPLYRELVIMLSDGQSDVSEDTLKNLVKNNQTVISVGIGNDVDTTLMQYISSYTSGRYVFCEKSTDLADIFSDLNSAYIGSSIDTDGDGLPDKAEIDGMRDQYGEIWTTDPFNPDSDGDGISDGEEMGKYNAVSTQSMNSTPYFNRISRPDMLTVYEKHSCVDVPEKLFYCYDSGKKELTVKLFTNAILYTVNPNLSFPNTSGEAPKEYFFAKPESINVKVESMPKNMSLVSINTKEIEDMYDNDVISYETTAVFSYPFGKPNGEIKWRISIGNNIPIIVGDNFETVEYSQETAAPYIEKTQNIGSTTTNPDVDELKNMIYEKETDVAELSLKLAQKIIEETENNNPGRTSSLDELKSHICVYSGNKETVVPNAVYEVFAATILNSLTGSRIEKYSTNQRKMAEEIYRQIKYGIVASENEIIINGIKYRCQIQSYAFAGVGTAWNYIRWTEKGKHYDVTLTWTNANDEEGKRALAEYMAVLGQLNTDVWKDFIAYYISDACGLLDIKTVTAKNVRDVLDKSEKIIYALCDNDAYENLMKEIGDKLGVNMLSNLNKLHKGLFTSPNDFKDWVKKNLPDGNELCALSNEYRKARKTYSDMVEAVNSLDAGKTPFGKNTPLAEMKFIETFMEKILELEKLIDGL